MGSSLMSMNNRDRYEEITDGETSNRSNSNSWSLMIVMSGMLMLLLGIIIVQGVHEHNVEHETLEHVQQVEIASQEAEATAKHALKHSKENKNDNQHDSAYLPFVAQNAGDMPMPPGVNIGSWLSLEDYFFSGLHNSVEVATPGLGKTAGKVASCLPPLHVGSTTGPKWQSETDLFQNLMDPNVTKGGSVSHAIKVFAAHRASYIDLETDPQKIAALGITSVRVPMGWCWTDKDPRNLALEAYESNADLLRDFACEDPFFGNDEGEEPILWPAIPKPLVEDLLRACARAGIKASLDVHTLPGGTSIGTFSGVWPHTPRFWTHGGDGVGVDGGSVFDTTTKGFDIGHKLVRELVEWMEDLSVRDPEAFAGLKGLSPMNEPAHLSGLSQPDDPDNFLPSLPRELADDYLDFLGSSSERGWFPDGTHLRVFYWFQGTIDIFRESKLPELGIEFQANIIESIFLRTDDSGESDDFGEQGRAIADWWCATNTEDDGESFHRRLGATSTVSSNRTTTTSSERSEWAVLDMHRYDAWSGTLCAGTIDGQDGAYACGDTEKRKEVLEFCSHWVPTFRQIVDNVCGVSQNGKHPKLMSGEFSASSFHSVRRSCTDTTNLREMYLTQINAASNSSVDLYYWSYKMPYGGSYKDSGWSFQELMYRFGVLGRPDESIYSCDSHLYDDPDIPP